VVLNARNVRAGQANSRVVARTGIVNPFRPGPTPAEISRQERPPLLSQRLPESRKLRPVEQPLSPAYRRVIFRRINQLSPNPRL
jgi:hypothetical protein